MIFRQLLSGFGGTSLLRLVSLLSAVLWIPVSLHSADVPPEEEIVNVRCYMLSFGSAIRDVVLPTGAGGKIQMPIISNLSPGIPLKYRGPRLMRFYKEKDYEFAMAAAAAAAGDASGEAVVIPPPFAETMLPANVPVVLLLFVPDGDSGRMRVAVLPFNEQNFGNGDYFFQNFTREQVAINVGGQTTMVLPAMASEVYHHTGGNTPEEGMVRMALLKPGEGAEIFYSSRWTHLQQQRTWVFLLPGKDGGKINVRRFHDVVADN